MMSIKNNKKVKNIIIINDFNYIQGGASKVAIQTANLLAEKCPDLNVYFFSGASDKRILDDKIIDICTNQGECLTSKNKVIGMKNGIYNNIAKRKLKELLSTLNNEETIIHIHGWTKCLSSSVFDAALEMNFKVVLTMHDYFTACPNGGYFNYKKNEICHFNPMSLKCCLCNCDSRNYMYKMYRLIRQRRYNKTLKKLKYVIAISDFSLNILKSTLPNDVCVTRINNPISFDTNEKMIDSSKNEYYLYAGRVSKEKGVDIFCQALTELDLPGVVVGDGDQKEILEKKFPKIKFVGWKSEKEVKDIMKKAKCLIFPSRLYECAPLTNLEALSVGLPSLVSVTCAASDINNKKNHNGDTFSVNVESLKETILNYDNNYKANFDILKDYSVDNYISKLTDYYNLIMNK